ncbi:MAG: hypothetical protein GY772_08580 [bacterium]|nr:hypothetical protein [bacterium]
MELVAHQLLRYYQWTGTTDTGKARKALKNRAGRKQDGFANDIAAALRFLADEGLLEQVRPEGKVRGRPTQAFRKRSLQEIQSDPGSLQLLKRLRLSTDLFS